MSKKSHEMRPVPAVRFSKASASAASASVKGVKWMTMCSDSASNRRCPMVFCSRTTRCSLLSCAPLPSPMDLVR